MAHARSILGLMALAVALAACGGGASGADPFTSPATSAKATLTGEVLSVDGSTEALDGVVLSLRETGQLVESDLDGWFSFGEVPTGTLTIDLVSASSFSAKGGSDDDDSNDDSDDDSDDDDDNDLDGGEMNMERVRAQERIHVRVRVQNGELGEMQCVREENTERETERHMNRTAENADPDMEGEVEMEQHQERQRFRVEAEHADPGLGLEAVVIAPDGTEENLGPRTVQADGECEWKIDTGDGGRLPFGVADVEDLQGYRVQVRAQGSGSPLLDAEVPGLPPFQGDATAAREQTREEERSQESYDDSDGLHDRDQDRDRDGNYGDDA